MMSKLQPMLGSARLHLPKTREAGVLTEALLDYELQVDQGGRERAGVFKVGTHDDLVCAPELATEVGFD